MTTYSEADGLVESYNDRLEEHGLEARVAVEFPGTLANIVILRPDGGREVTAQDLTARGLIGTLKMMHNTLTVLEAVRAQTETVDGD